MADPNGTDSRKNRIRSLRELQQDIPPSRDLWPDIAARIERHAQGAAHPPVETPSRRPRLLRVPWVALAAAVAALAIGVWVGRELLPASGSQAPGPLASNGTQPLLPAAFVNDPRYLEQRRQLVQQLEKKLASLPPETQNKVTASLATIRQSIADIQAALGRDPGNALLQELLVNTYQDEMRVLTAVNQAQPRQEI